MQDLLIELRNNDAKIKEIEKDEKISLSNVTGDLIVRLKDKEKELGGATENRKRIIESQIQNINNDIELAKEQIHPLFDTKKIDVYKESFDKILKYAVGMKDAISEIVSKKEDELKTVKNNIIKANDSNDFKLVKKLSDDAFSINSSIKSHKNILANVNNLVNDIENTMDKINDLTFEKIDAILKGYKSDIMEINILLGNSKKNDVVSNDIDEKTKKDLKLKKELEEKIVRINELLKKAENEKDEKALKESINLINSLPDGEDKNKLQAKADEIKENLNKKVEEENAQKAIETATITGSKSDIQKAYDAVGLIKNETKNEELTNKLDELVKKITMNFISTLNRLKEVYERNKNAKVKREEITKLVSDFDNLYKDEIPEIGFSKKSAIKDVDWVILSYNATKQKEYQENQEVETNEKGKIKKIFSIFKSFLELKPIVSTTKLMAKFFKKKLAKNVEKGNDEKVKKYENIIREMDIVNSVTMFRKKNEIAKMKPKLYKNGTDGLDAKEKDKYYVSQNVISSILLKQLLNKTGEDVYKDKLRVKTVISQWLDLYTRIGTDEVVVSDLLKRENVIYTKEKIKEEIDEFLNNARRAKSITRAEYISYLDELRNIDFYKANYDDYYEIPSVKYEDGSYYEELEDKKKYYKQPVIYKDLDKEISISYIKK